MANINVATLTATLRANTGQFNAAMGGASKSVSKAHGGITGLGKSVVKTTAAFAGLATVSAGIRTAGAAIVGFDKNMRNVNSLAQLSERDFRSLEKQVASLAGKTAQAPRTLAAGLYDLVSSGFKSKDAMVVLEASAYAATAGLTTTEVSAGAVAGAINAYGLKAKDASKVSDILFRTVDQGVITFEQLAQGIGPVLPVARKLGVSLDQVGAFTATLTKAGIPAAEAFTYQKGAMVALIKPTDKLQEVFKKLGVQSGAQLVKKFGSVQGGLEAISKAVGGNETAMAALFPEIRGMTAAFGVTSQKSKDAARDFDALKNSSGATARALAEQSKSISYQWQRLKAAIEGLVIKAFISLNEWIIRNKETIRQYASQIASVGSALARFAQAIGLVKAATTLFDGVGRVLRGTLGTLAAAMRGDLMGALRQVGTALSGVGRIMLAPFIGAISAVRRALANTGFGRALSSAVGDVAGAVSRIVSTMTGAVGRFVSAGARWIAGLASGVASKVGSVVGRARELGAKAVEVFHNLGPRFVELGSNLIQGLINGILSRAKDVANAAKNVAAGAVNGVKSFLKIGSPSKVFFGIGADTISGFVNGIAAGKARVASTLKSSLLFPLDKAIADLGAKRATLEARFGLEDTRREGGRLRGALAQARKKGEGIGEAKQALADFAREAKRARALARIDLQVTGIERAKNLRDTLTSISSTLKDKLAAAVSDFRANWEKTTGAAFDTRTGEILAGTETARELQRLRDETTAEDLKAQQAQISEAYSQAQAEGDAAAMAAAQQEQIRFDRNQRIAQLERDLAAEQARIETERAAERQRLEDEQAAAFEEGLQRQLDAEFASLQQRKQSYATFVKDVQAILGALGLEFDASASDEAAMAPPPKRKRRRRRRRTTQRAIGGMAFGRTLVGEWGPEVVNLPMGSRVYSDDASRRMLGGDGSGGRNYYSISVQNLDPQAAGPAVVRAIQEFERRNGATWRA